MLVCFVLTSPLTFAFVRASLLPLDVPVCRFVFLAAKAPGRIRQLSFSFCPAHHVTSQHAGLLFSFVMLQGSLMH
jgi:hypothetical protein